VTASILDGKKLARELQESLAGEVAEFTKRHAITPRLSVVLVGENPASEVYVRNKRQACERVGIDGRLHPIPADAPGEALFDLLDELNADTTVHGILVQLPLPKSMDSVAALDAVNPLKDVDAFHAENVGLLVQGRPRFLPCTPYGIQQLLMRNDIEIAGKHVVVVGRSDIVGKPMANMLVQRGPGGDATVTICHSRTRNLAEVTRSADILIAAIGQAKMIGADMVRPGAVVVDVGMNRIESGLVGDVDFESVREVASAITPVPGGVGPLTVTMLLKNTLTAARLAV
jgi:methylenetetrahydrofolate dehydrogenase (NADP+)/methenyltetrahydrofolate cyclohydrolase